MDLERVDLLAIKQQMASIMPVNEGKTYWTAMQRFFTAKLTRAELERVLDKLLPTSDLVALHNKLIQGVLLNTTRAALPPPGRHTGWLHRDHPDDDQLRGDDETELDPVQRKRRKLKHTVMRVGKYERAQLKAMTKIAKPKRPTLLDEMDSQGPPLLPNGLPAALEGAMHPPATLQQDYLRALQAPLCCESRYLPSLDEMRDRMSLIAYETGLTEGVDLRAALLLNEAIHLHLKTVLSSLFTLMRNSKERKKSDIERKIRTHDCEALFDMTPSLTSQPHLGTIERLMALPPPALQSDEELDSASSSGAETEDEEVNADTTQQIASNGGDSGNAAKASLSRRSSGKRPSRSSLRPRASSSSMSVAAPKREALLIDPSVPSLAKPQYPELVSPFASGRPNESPSQSQFNDSNGASSSAQQQDGALMSTSSIGVAKSERELQNELFPEMNGTSSASGAVQQSQQHQQQAAGQAQSVEPSLTRSGSAAALASVAAASSTSAGLNGANSSSAAAAGGHSSDGSSDDEDGVSRRKDPSGSNAQQGGPNAGGALAGSNAAGATASAKDKKKKKRRNLWEVVDSVKLLDGVLD